MSAGAETEKLRLGSMGQMYDALYKTAAARRMEAATQLALNPQGVTVPIDGRPTFLSYEQYADYVLADRKLGMGERLDILRQTTEQLRQKSMAARDVRDAELYKKQQGLIERQIAQIEASAGKPDLETARFLLSKNRFFQALKQDKRALDLKLAQAENSLSGELKDPESVIGSLGYINQYTDKPYMFMMSEGEGPTWLGIPVGWLLGTEQQVIKVDLPVIGGKRWTAEDVRENARKLEITNEDMLRLLMKQVGGQGAAAPTGTPIEVRTKKEIEAGKRRKSKGAGGSFAPVPGMSLGDYLG